MKDLYTDLLEIIEPYLSDFTGYDEKEQAFNIVLAVKELLSEFNTENERLREDYIKLSQQKDLDNARWQKRCTDLHVEDKAKADKYWLVLQEIKAIAMGIIDDNIEESSAYSDARQIIDLITKAEEE